MSKEKTQRSVHYNPTLKQMTVDMWLNGKSEYEIDKAIRTYISKMRRNRKSRSTRQS